MARTLTQKELEYEIADEMIEYADEHAHLWRERDDHYWLARLNQEVGELASSLVGDHADPVEHELKQIASIAINWLRKREIDKQRKGRPTPKRTLRRQPHALKASEK